MTFGDKS